MSFDDVVRANFLGNPIEQWLVALLLAAGLSILIRIVRRILVKRVSLLAKYTTTPSAEASAIDNASALVLLGGRGRRNRAGSLVGDRFNGRPV